MTSDSIKKLAEELRREIKKKLEKKTRPPLTWQFAKNCFKIGKFWMYWSEIMESKYNESKRLTKMNWDSVSSQIKHEVFEMKCETDVETGKQTVKGPIKRNERRLTPSKFPYFYEPDVKNYVLWYGNEEETEEQKEWISQCEELENYDLIIFKNARDVKYVKPIPLLHILAREAEDKTDRKILILKEENKGFNATFKKFQK